MKTIISLLTFSMSVCLSGQNTLSKDAVTYFKNGQQVSENQEWDIKNNTRISENKAEKIIDITSYNPNGQIVKKSSHKEDKTKKINSLTSEEYYIDAGCKTVTFVSSDGKNINEVSIKCLSMDDKVISKDQPCSRKKAVFDEKRLLNWLAGKSSILSSEVSSNITYHITFEVTPQKEVSVISIESKNKGAYPSVEKKLANIISAVPKELLANTLDTIEGKEVKTVMNIPVIIQNRD